jgi:hypothetical protein
MRGLNRLVAALACVVAAGCGEPSPASALIGAWQGPATRGATTGCSTGFEGTWTFRFYSDGSFSGRESSACTDPRSGCQASATTTGAWMSSRAGDGVTFVTISMEGPTTYTGCTDAWSDGTTTDSVTTRYRYAIVGRDLALTPVDDRDVAFGATFVMTHP